MTYAEKLRDPRWQKKRLEVFNRDNFKCRCCKAGTETLHVHHKHYEKDKEPWEYDLDYLITLCEDCHDILSTVLRETKRIIEDGFINPDILYEVQKIIKLFTKYNSPVPLSEIREAIELNQKN
jgi:hypothetical protein